MIKTGFDTARALEGNNRHFALSLSFDFLSLRRDTAVRLYAPNAAAGSIPEQIIETGFYIADRLFVGTSAKNKLFPSIENIFSDGLWHEKRSLKKSRVGYIGKKADATGSNDDTVSVSFSKRTVSAISLESAGDRIIIDAVVTVLDDYGKILFTQTLISNTQKTLQIFCAVPKSSAISIHITKSTPNKRVWILTFTPSFQMSFSSNDIVSVKHESKKSQNKDATIGRTYLQSLDIQLFNNKRQFDFLNTDSALFGALKKNIEISAYLSLSGTDFSIPLGLFYADSFEVGEDKATVTVKAVDYFGAIKDDDLPILIKQNASASSFFNALARGAGLANNDIDSSLDHIPLPLYAASGKIGAAFNDLCEITQSTCMMNAAGDGIIVRRSSSLRGTSRYPLRYFTTDDYIKADTHKTGAANPNSLTIEYSLSQYEQSEIVDKKTEKVFMYSQLPVRTFPAKYLSVLPQNRPIGAEEPPSSCYTFRLSDEYLRTELSDSFEPQNLEYTLEENRQNKTVTVTIWVFAEHDESEQLTIAPIISAKSHNILLSEESHIVPAKPENYTSQITSDDIEERNRYNTPAEFEVKLSGKTLIDYIVPMNIQKPGLFEFAVKQTASGCIARIWNYLPYEQTFSLDIYGKRIIDSPDKKSITIKNEDAILTSGEIKKTVILKGVASDAVAFSQARSIACFYQTFKSNLSFEPWADPRLQIGDCIAYESLRGYGYTEGIVEEISLSYEGFVSQKLKILQSEKHNRDCRVTSGYILADRPVMSRKMEGYV